MKTWSTEQLTEFLAAVSSQPSADATVIAAAECAAEVLDAEIGAVVRNGAVVSAIGFGACPHVSKALVRVARGQAATVEVEGVGPCQVGVGRFPDEPGSALIVGRSGDDPFAADELNLLRGMSRVLTIVLANLALLDAERAHVAENQVLSASVEQHALLLEQLSRLQDSISRSSGLQEVLDTIVAGGARLLGVDIATLNLIDANDSSFVVGASSIGVNVEGRSTMWRMPLGEGASGRAIATGKLFELEDYRTSAHGSRLAPAGVEAAIAVPVHEHGEVIGALVLSSREAGKQWTASERDLLTIYAEHASLTLAAARTADRMRHAFNDSLTGLPNRALFLDRLEHLLYHADRAGSPVCVLFLDLDRFKIVNDTLGHLVGDRLLVAVAARVRDCLRRSDTCARLGGDEFAIILGPDSETDPERVAERIISALRPAFDLEGREFFISASIGIATGNGEAETLLRNADVSMYRAKSLGKGRYAWFEQSMHDDLVHRLELDADLRRALDREEFELHYQPILHLETGRVQALEALVRWRHPERGLVPPLDFIPLAEETGLIHRLGQWVLEEAVRQAAEWQADVVQDPPISVSVNLSGRQLQQPDLVDQVAAALKGRLDPQYLILEITETVLMHDTEETIDTLTRLKALGVRIAIDDFGTGYSSLRYLSRFPADILKIAKPFVDAIGLGDSALTQAIVGLGAILGVETIAEGIEEPVQADRLRAVGCTLGQGFLFSRPIEGSRLLALLRGDGPADRLVA